MPASSAEAKASSPTESNTLPSAKRNKPRYSVTAKERKPPGVRAKEGGTKLKQGAAVQVKIYPRPEMKAALVKASRKNGQTVSSFLILAGLEKAARLQGCTVEDLVPQDEIRQ